MRQLPLVYYRHGCGAEAVLDTCAFFPPSFLMEHVRERVKRVVDLMGSGRNKLSCGGKFVGTTKCLFQFIVEFPLRLGQLTLRYIADGAGEERAFLCGERNEAYWNSLPCFRSPNSSSPTPIGRTFDDKAQLHANPNPPLGL